MGLRIGVLTRDGEVFSTRRLLAAGATAGHDMVLLPILETSVVVGARARLRDAACGVAGHELDVVVPRIGAYFPVHGLALLRHLEGRGVPAVNSAAAIELARDKLRTHERLGSVGLGVPRTVLVKDLEQVGWAVSEVSGPPAVIKTLGGAQGRRVVLADTFDGAVSVVEAFLLLNQDVLVQEYYAAAVGEDLRVLVVAGEAVAAVRRRAPAGRFRSNLHQGGTVEALVPGELESGELELAQAAAAACGLAVAGVDILESGAGPVVIEVNASPGLEGIERATGLDLAARIVQHAVEVATAAKGSTAGVAPARGGEPLTPPLFEGP